MNHLEMKEALSLASFRGRLTALLSDLEFGHDAKVTIGVMVYDARYGDQHHSVILTATEDLKLIISEVLNDAIRDTTSKLAELGFEEVDEEDGA